MVMRFLSIATPPNVFTVKSEPPLRPSEFAYCRSLIPNVRTYASLSTKRSDDDDDDDDDDDNDDE